MLIILKNNKEWDDGGAVVPYLYYHKIEQMIINVSFLLKKRRCLKIACASHSCAYYFSFSSHLIHFYHVYELFKLLTGHWNNFAKKYYFSNENKSIAVSFLKPT